MARWGKHTGARLAIGLGGCLDVFAGNVDRAPEQWQKLGLEWAYRLKKEPKRIGRMAKLPLVLVQAAGARLRGKGGKG
jgi:N-acetylglucosaminyldiphosphoundecaprenol N-acetyl-beta-D-mannosaminyltransferase